MAKVLREVTIVARVVHDKIIVCYFCARMARRGRFGGKPLTPNPLLARMGPAYVPQS